MYSFRFVHPSDLPWLAQAASFGSWESLSPEEMRHAAWPTVAYMAGQQVESTLTQHGGLGLVATAWHRPVGYVLAAPGPDSSTDEITGHLFSLWVAPEHRRRGVGTALLSLAENWFLQQGIRKVKLLSGVHNRTAVRLAERAGYKPEGLIGIKPL